jgi:GNAT superfamily N-acetyltransferase
MLELRRSSPVDQEFLDLIEELDKELWERYPSTQQNHAAGNRVAADARAVVARAEGSAIGCACFRPASRIGAAELKRMFVRPERRGSPAAASILAEIENWAIEEGYSSMLLETGVRQPEALRFYGKRGYHRIPNYGEYEGNVESICMAKRLDRALRPARIQVEALREVRG